MDNFLDFSWLIRTHNFFIYFKLCVRLSVATSSFLPGHEQDHTTYLVTDISKDNYRFHVGIGHGWTAASDAWMLKFILGGIPLGELINPNRW